MSRLADERKKTAGGATGSQENPPEGLADTTAAVTGQVVPDPATQKS